MIKSSFYAFVLLWTHLANAQYGGGGETSMTTKTTAAATTSASASGSIQTVNVGKSGLTYDPDSLNVASGDKVEFHFFPGDHSVAQAAFDNPCHPLSSSSFFSGFVSPSSGESVCPANLRDDMTR
jgi:plastocyanin